MDRRKFVKLCAGGAAMLAAGLRAAQAKDFTDFPRVRLTDAAGAPLKAAALTGEQAYVFHYPFRSLPCFLIDLGKAAAGPQNMKAEWGEYAWPGGAGPGKNLVAYVAVCSHQLSYPDKDGSEIRYAAGKSALAGKSGTIVCCAHDSVFDPAAGANRLHGEAEYPLAAIRIEHDAADDGLYATGLAGVELAERFFRVHKRRLIVEYGPGVYREPVGEVAPAIPFDKYTASASNC